MRSTLIGLRLFVALLAIAGTSWKLLLIGGLPVAPHAMPVGDARFLAQVLGIVWWIAVALAASSITTILSLTIGRLARKRDRAQKFLNDALSLIYALLAIVAASTFVLELPVSTVFATSSIVAVVLGFALQNTISDLMSGIALLIEQPFRIGDRIDYTGRPGGLVTEMNWRATRVLTRAGDVVIIPNSMLNRSEIVNHDAVADSLPHRTGISFKLPNDLSPIRATELLRVAALNAQGVLHNPAPSIEIDAFGDWAIEYRITYYYRDHDDKSKIGTRVYAAVWTHLTWAGIAQPIPRTMIVDPLVPPKERPLPRLLKRLTIFEGLSDDDRTELAALLAEQSVRVGEKLIEAGAQGDSLFIVREGTFDIRVRDGDGIEQSVAQLYPGDYVGEASLLTGAPRNATVVASTAASVYAIDRARFEPFVRERPEIAEALAAGLVKRAAQRDAALAQTSTEATSALAAVAAQIRTFFRAR